MSKQNGTRLTNDKGLTRIAFDELKKKGSANFRRCRDRDVAPFRQSIQKKNLDKRFEVFLFVEEDCRGSLLRLLDRA